MFNIRKLFGMAAHLMFPPTAPTARMQRKLDRQIIGGKVVRNSRYTPHQGKQEIARRNRQIANGRLATN